ncbi:MAG TPA: 50S ribosomal protein L22 [Chloroflexota bacterium]|nr:50S ribosomal protein L22 [Chloroflexota bacterium]
MEVRATAKYVHMSPRKVRLVVDLIRGKRVTEAEGILRNLPNAAAREVYKVVHSAAANAENNYDLTVEDLVVVNGFANDGPTMKRFRPRPQGRAVPIMKRSSNITIVVDER